MKESKTFRLVGSNYKYTGPVWHYIGKTNEKQVGEWNSGILVMYDGDISKCQANLEKRIKKISPDVGTEIENNIVKVNFRKNLILEVEIKEEFYKIFNTLSDWNIHTSYYCENDNEGKWLYYLETIDECIGEIRRMIEWCIEDFKIDYTGKDLLSFTIFSQKYYTKDFADMARKCLSAIYNDNPIKVEKLAEEGFKITASDRIALTKNEKTLSGRSEEILKTGIFFDIKYNSTYLVRMIESLLKECGYKPLDCFSLNIK